MGFLNTMMLLGLVAVAIPPLIHLLNRRRFDVVDWGAMQFLQISETTRRRLLIEEIILMALRMGLIAVMVLALASPYPISPWLTRMTSNVGSKPNRDVVLVFDGSYSMGFTPGAKPQAGTPHEKAKEWALAYVDGLTAGDSVAILQAKQQVVKVLGEPSHDLEKVREAIRKLPEPRGGSDWPRALDEAQKILGTSSRARDIIILSDAQKHGWADESTLLHWELLANKLEKEKAGKTNVWVVNVAHEEQAGRKAEPANWSLAPLRASRAIASAEQEIRFRTSLQLYGQESYKPPYRLRLDIDGGRERRDLEFPATARLEKGQVPLTFSHRFTTPGSHLVSVTVEPDPPADQRPVGYQVKDELPGDNRQDIAVEVVQALPVLIVDGDSRPTPKHRGSDFIRDALAPARDLTPVVLAKVVPIQEFDGAMLTARGVALAGTPERDAASGGQAPRVLILCNVPRLTPAQNAAIVDFLREGGTVLVTLGERVDTAYYNEQLYRGGDGWLPARLDDKTGSEAEESKAVSPLPSSFFHPALDLFRESASGGLADARFPRWWKVSTPGRSVRATPVALLSSTDPFLVEKPYERGRVLLCSVPMDNSWRTDFPDLLAYAPLVHELVYYLAGARATEHNLQPGQPLRYRPEGDVTPAPLTLQPPEGEAKKLPVTGWPLTYEETLETGVYRLTAPDGKPVYYVVQPDMRESDLAALAEEDREKVASRVGDKIALNYQDDRTKLTEEAAAAGSNRELWWWFMIGVLVMLCCEVWMTRRIAMNR